MRLNAENLSYSELNGRLRTLLAAGITEIEVDGIRGQRYLAAALQSEGANIRLRGVAGNDLACFMGSGIHLEVRGSAQDAAGNTMGGGKIVIHGHAGDATGYAMTGGKLFVLGDIGYRAGIHMKAFQDQVPLLVIGGRAGAFLGEYMAGGIIISLGLTGRTGSQVGSHLGAGMHGGVIYVRGGIETRVLGEGAVLEAVTEQERMALRLHLEEYCRDMGLEIAEVMAADYVKVVPLSNRPYGTLYAY